MLTQKGSNKTPSRKKRPKTFKAKALTIYGGQGFCFKPDLRLAQQVFCRSGQKILKRMNKKTRSYCKRKCAS